jgi:hypothetical protein
MNEIKSIVEFNTILISWREPYIEGKQRRRYVVARLIRNGDDADLEYLIGTEDFENATEKGFDGFKRFPISVKKHSNVIEYFSYRLPPKKRADFDTFMKSIGLDVSLKDQISYFQLLGYSGGKLPDDTFNFHIDYSNISLPVQMYIELTGILYQNDWKLNIDKIAVDDQIVLVRDMQNSFDSFAVEAYWKNQRIGYIDRVLSKIFCTWIDEGRSIIAYISRKNGTSERPRLYLFVNIK